MFLRDLPKQTKHTGRLWGAITKAGSISTTSWGWIFLDATKYLPTDSFCCIRNALHLFELLFSTSDIVVVILSGQWIFIQSSEHAVVFWQWRHKSCESLLPHRKHSDIFFLFSEIQKEINVFIIFLWSPTCKIMIFKMLKLTQFFETSWHSFFLLQKLQKPIFFLHLNSISYYYLIFIRILFFDIFFDKNTYTLESQKVLTSFTLIDFFVQSNL